MASQFITCGMYAFTCGLRQAWQALFTEFVLLIDQNISIEARIRFDAEFDVLRHPDLFIGHTCGYPLMRFLQQDCNPVCVPVFDVDGCEGKYYSSRFVVAVDSDISEMSQCYDRVAAINGRHSNSGMNVLRYAVAQCGQPPPFFSGIIESGSHFNSLQAVADGRADIAAIDCVSYAFIDDEWPQLTSRVKTIGFSAATCGLPLVTRKNQPCCNSETMTSLLNEALASLATNHRKALHLGGFCGVSRDDYQGIINLETEADQAGFPILR